TRTQRLDLARLRGRQDAIELPNVPDPALMCLLDHGAQKRAPVAAPTALRPFAVGNERPGELLDVVIVRDLPVQIPLRRFRLEWIEDDVAAARVVEASQIAAVRVGDDGPVASLERA